jgi:hypothetical protein
MSRLRASSSAFPPGLDLRAQYRTIQSQNNSPHGSTPRSSSFASSFSGGYASAPLSAPVDFSLPRTPVDASHAGNRDFNIPQLSAPMNAPQDFSNAYTSSARAQQQSDRDFETQGSNSGEPGGQGQVQLSPQQQQARNGDEASYLRSVDYETGQKRKRSYTTPSQFESP